MTQAKSIDSYGGLYVDEAPIANPETQLGADLFNRLAEDVAQMTRICPKASARFTAFSGGATKTYTSPEVTVRSQWGSGTPQKPTVEKTADGLYSLTWPTSFLDTVGLTEAVSFFDGLVTWRTGDVTDLPTDNHSNILTVGSNLVTIALFDSAGLADNGTTSGTDFIVTVHLW